MNLIIYLNIQMKELIKETGQTQSVSFDIIFDNDVDTEKYTTNKTFYHEVIKDYNTDDVELSDGKTYKKSELIIGTDNIRNYKIKNITN